MHGLTSMTLGVPDVDAVASYYEDFGLRRVGDRPGRGLLLAALRGGENQPATRPVTHPAQPEVLVVRRHRVDVRDTQGHRRQTMHAHRVAISLRARCRFSA